MKSVHWSFWLIGVVALIWNLLGSINFVVQMIPGMTEGFRESERAIIESRPVWATFGFGLAVFGGVIGSLLLLLRKSVALFFFVASAVGVAVAMIHALGSGISFGVGEIIGIVVMPFAVAVFMIWFSKRARSKGWIG